MNRAWRSFTYFTSPTIYRTLAFAVLLTSCVVLATHVVRWRRAGIREHPDSDQVHAALMQAAESLGGHDPAGQTKLGELAERLRRQDGGDFPWPAGPMAGVAVSLLALAAESRLARLLRRRTMHGHFYGMGRTRRDDKHPLLSTLYNTLFRYRLTNPDEERFRSELRLARQIQFNMTPEQSSSPPATSPDYDIDALLAPAEEVGGDFYDYFLHADGRLVLAVGDVAGHGMAAAMYMAACRTAFRALAETSPDPSVLLERLNDTMVRDHRSGIYVTIACFFLP